MLRDRTGRIALILIVIFLVMGSWAYYQYWSLVDRVRGEYHHTTFLKSNPVSPLDSIALDSVLTDSSLVDSSVVIDTLEPFRNIDWFSDSFDPHRFSNPDKKYRPWAKWYWPGNEVDRLELIREIQFFHDQGLGGVELQPLSSGLDPKMKAESIHLNEFRTENYQHNLKLVLQELQKRGMSADINNGTGWPAGGTHISIENSLKTLAVGEIHILGGKKVEVEIPGPKMPAAYYLSSYFEEEWNGEMGEWLNFYPEEAKLLTLIASKTLEDKRTFINLDINDYISLDSDSLFLIDQFLENNKNLVWDAPKGFWKIIAIYQMPVGENVRFSSNNYPGLVMDYLDSSVVIDNYNALLGKDECYEPYMGNSLRGIYNHRLEFLAENLISNDALTYFEKNREYNLVPYLPTILNPGQDNALMDLLELKRGPEYTITEVDERIRNDYQKTISELLNKHFFKNSSDWAKEKNLLNRAQPFGFDFDIIKSAGSTHIPDASQLYGGGSELFLKLVSSGANLYNRNLISAEAMSHPYQGATLSPWKKKLGVDKLFTAGINQIVFNGSPYKKVKGDYTELGWNPFQSPWFLFQFSGSFNELEPFSKYERELNEYITRCQYMLRQGNPETEVLIYYPFMGFPNSFSSDASHQEAYFNGESFYPDEVNYDKLYQKPEIDLPTEKAAEISWLESAYSVIQKLEERGISWSWVNDESLQAAKFSRGDVDIRGNKYQTVLLLNVPEIEIQSAENLLAISQKGGRVYVYGEAPLKQKSFIDQQRNDALLARYMAGIAVPDMLNSPEDLMNLFRGEPFAQTISYSNTYPFLRQIRRATDDGHISFFRNTLDKDRFFELNISPKVKHCYWFNPENGDFYKAEKNKQNRLKGYLNAFQSTILYCSFNEKLPDSLVSKTPRVEQSLFLDSKVNSQNLERWDLIVSGKDVLGGQVIYSDTVLMDWREIAALKYSSSEGLYTRHLEIGKPHSGKRYILDLGTVYEAADVKINTELVKSLIHHPYRVDITDHLIPGPNTIEIWITPALRNRFVGYGMQGKPAYLRYRAKDSQLLPTGLLGPVRLWEVNK